MATPGRAFKENPFRRLELDLLHTGAGPIYGHVGAASDGNEFARAHYEQHMQVEGELRIEGASPILLSGFGLRDHSWGPRYWQSTPSYRWITANFGADLGMVLSWIGGKVAGAFHRGQDLLRVTDLELQTEYEPGTKFHKGLRALVKLDDGSTTQISGTVIGFIPLRNRRAGAETYIGEGMTEYRLDDGRVGYGLSEYLDQPESSGAR
jgi:hypothetical protein